jgi:hypothetical protein
VAYDNSTTGQGVSTTPAVAVPTGVAAGEIVILTLSYDAPGVTITWPAGFTQLVQGNNTDQSTAAAWKRLTGADSGTYNLSVSGSAFDWVCQAFSFTGRDAVSNPVASAASVDNSSQSTPVSIAANGVTAVAGDDLLWVGALDLSASGAANVFTAPSGYTSRQAQESSGGWAALCGATKDAVGAGATGTVTGSCTLTSATAFDCGLLIRIPGAATTHVFDASARSAAATTNPRTLSHVTAAAADVLVLFIAVGSATNRSGGTPTYNGVAMTQGGTTQKAAASPEGSMEVWYLLNPPAGTFNFSVPNAGAASIVLSSASFIPPAGKTSGFCAAGGGNGTSTNPTANVTTTDNNCLLVAGVFTGATTWAPSARTGTQLFDNDSGAVGEGSQYLLDAGTAGVKTMAWTFGTSDDWGEVVVAFKMVSAGIDLISALTSEAAVTANLTTAITPASALACAAAVTANLSTAIRLATSMAGAAVVTAALTTAIQLVTSMAAQASVTANLTTAIPLQTVMACTAAMTNNVQSPINLSTAMAAQSSIAANLATQIPLTSAFAAQAAVTAPLTTAIRFSSALASQSAVTAALTTQIRFTSTLQAVAALNAALNAGNTALATALASVSTLQAALTTAIRLQSSAQSIASLQAALTTAIRLASTLQAQATLTAALTTQIPLATSAASVANLTAALTTSIALRTDMACDSSVQAVLSTEIALGSAMQCAAELTALLSVIVPLTVASIFNVPAYTLGISAARTLQQTTTAVPAYVITTEVAQE